jgi:excinuclease ABC subunit A
LEKTGKDKGARGSDHIEILGAREHNLRNIDVIIPRNNLVVITGLSGSGKSSLAFDTIYAEGQRRYMETLSAYARQFMGSMERPDVDKISGLSPVIAIEQKTNSKNPRSTVGTITEVYDFLRLLYARASIAYSSETGEEMVRYTDDQIINLIIEKYLDKKIVMLAPVVKGRKGHYKELFEQISRKGFLYARVNGNIQEIKPGFRLDRYKTHNIEIVIDKLVVTAKDKKRLGNTIQTSMHHGGNVLMILDTETEETKYFSKQLMCPTSGISYNEPAPHSFSFNSPRGACHKCHGLGTVSEVDVSKIIPDARLSIRKGGIEPLGPYKNSLIFWQLEAIASKYQFTLNTPLGDIPEDALNTILYGSEESFKLLHSPLGATSNYFMSFDGVISYIAGMSENGNGNGKPEKRAGQYLKKIICPGCHGTRLKQEALNFRINNKNISQLAEMDIELLSDWFASLENKLSKKQKIISSEIIKEVRARLGFLMSVGLNYLSLNRSSASLSGGESQRIRLATQVGSQLVNVLYILDEPSIGLHQRDNLKLIDSLKQLRDKGNSIIVVEHDRDMILAADHVIDMGPRAGRQGGEVTAFGSPEDISKTDTLTGCYLSGQREIKVPDRHREGNELFIKLRGASGNNLKNVDVDIPLGKFICVTGVSGSGKSSLIKETLQPILSRHFYRSLAEPLPYAGITGTGYIDKIIEVDQSPIGRTPRSNPATYTGVFSDIRKIFEQTPEAKIRGYKAGRFSFNVKGGRCESCRGAGVQTIEMNFLPDVYVLCKECNGKRYNRETLEVKYKGKSISDVLELTINQSADLFEKIPAIARKIKTLQKVGMGYIKLGQASTTLSGGESQRVKLSTELAKKDTGKTLYVLDEPTTGLHFEDIRVLLNVLNSLADKGNTVIVIEHNMDVIKVADHIIDMGPLGGNGGGEIIACGTPEEVSRQPGSFTGEHLRQIFKPRKIEQV